MSAKNYQNRLMCIEAILCNISAVLLRHSVDMSSAIISTVQDRRSVALSQMWRKCAPQVRSDRRKTINDFICHFIKYRTHLAATYNKKNIYKRMTIQTQLEFRMLTSTLAKNTGDRCTVRKGLPHTRHGRSQFSQRKVIPGVGKSEICVTATFATSCVQHMHNTVYPTTLLQIGSNRCMHATHSLMTAR